jgi:MFS family permease
MTNHSTNFLQLAKITYLEFLKKYFGELYIIALPAIAISLELKRSNVQLAIPIYFLFVLLTQYFSGKLADIVGYKKLMMYLTPVFVLGNIISVFISNQYILYLGISLSAIGIGSVATLGKALVYQVSKKDKHKSILYFVFTSYVVVWAPAVGMVTGGLISHFYNWKLIFLINILLGSAAFLTVFFLKDEINPYKESIMLPTSHRGSQESYTDLIRSKYTLLPMLSISCLAGGVIAYYSITSFYFHYSLGISLSIVGFFAIFIVLGNLIGKSLAIKVSILFGIQITSILGSFISLLSALTMLLLNMYIADYSIYSVVSPMFTYMIGLGISMPTTRAYLFDTNDASPALISSLTGMIIAITTVLVGLSVSFLHIKSPLPLATMLVFLASLSFLMSCLATNKSKP